MSAPDLIPAFLDDIVASPDDPSPVLILADWLAERDDPRAELVRLTWQLLHDRDHADFASRQKRLQGLLAGGMVPVWPRLTLGDHEFAWVPPGSFLMGSPKTERRRDGDETQHRVTVTRGFWLGVYPITQGQWQAVLGDNPSVFHLTGGNQARLQGVTAADLERFPVDNVSWSAAVEFCQKLSEHLGRYVCLPTEAQWEYACRAGTTTTFHFGPSLNGTQANCDGRKPCGTRKRGPYLNRPTLVGSYAPNAWGLYDMHGNVWEWMQDAYTDDYSARPATDPLNEQEDWERYVVRGGSWLGDARDCRSASRSWSNQSDAALTFGLRVCLGAE
jgi:uncharacterized protein (TIGR02996 family)